MNISIKKIKEQYERPFTNILRNTKISVDGTDADWIWWHDEENWILHQNNRGKCVFFNYDIFLAECDKCNLSFSPEEMIEIIRSFLIRNYNITLAVNFTVGGQDNGLRRWFNMRDTDISFKLKTID